MQKFLALGTKMPTLLNVDHVISIEFSITETSMLDSKVQFVPVISIQERINTYVVSLGESHDTIDGAENHIDKVGIGLDSFFRGQNGIFNIGKTVTKVFNPASER